MNSKTRALLWEEIRIGGVLAAAITLVGLLALAAAAVAVHSQPPSIRWNYIGDHVTGAIVTALLSIALLLSLNRTSSDHLAAGFSRRGLRLPVDTWHMVLVVLVSRVLLLMAASGILTSTCQVLFGVNTGLRTLFLIIDIYLLFQLIDWLMAPAKVLAILLLCAGSLGYILYLGYSVSGEVSLSGDMSLPLAGASVLWAVFAYGAALAAVRKTRYGDRVVWLSVPGWEYTAGQTRQAVLEPFRSPFMAQLWYEHRRLGGAMFATFGIAYLVCVIAVGLVSRLEDIHLSMGLWDLQVVPYAAFLVAIIAGALKRERRPRGHVTALGFHMPITRALVEKARLTATGIRAVSLLGLVTIISTLAFFCDENGMALRVLLDTLHTNILSMRHAVLIILGPPVFAAVLGCAFYSLRLKAATLGMLATILAGAFFLLGNISHFDTGMYVSWCMGGGLSLCFLVDLVLVWRKRWISTHAFAGCLAVWAGIALLVFPAMDGDTFTSQALLVALGIAALAVWSYPAGIRGDKGHSWRVRIQPENPEQHRRLAPAQAGPGRVVWVVALVAGVLFLAWMRWPAEPAWKAVWREKHLPASLAELNAWYKPVDDAHNLAARYMPLKDKVTKLDAECRKETAAKLDADRRALAVKRTNPVDTTGNTQEPAIDFRQVFAMGTAERLGKTDAIPEPLWKSSHRYWELAQGVVGELRAVAASGLTESRYPLDLNRGIMIELPHLSGFRNLARLLCLDAWVNAIEHRPHEAAEAILATRSIAESLKSEPVFISQLVRMALYGIMVDSTESAINRALFEEDDLRRLQEGFAHALPPMDQELMIDRGMTGEQIFCDSMMNPFLRYQAEAGPTRLSSLTPVAGFLYLTGIDTFDRTVGFYIFSTFYEQAHRQIETKPFHLPSHRSNAWGNCLPVEPIPSRAIVSRMTLPALGRSYESEWRCRTRLDVARTALAVERYRVAQGHLPKGLDGLVPAYMDAIPGDPWNDGNPLAFQANEDGSFVVRSLVDYHRVEKEKRTIEFSVAAPEFRARNQIPGEQ